MKTLALLAIRGYQKFISPYKGFSCAHRVHAGGRSCSSFGYRAIERNGLFTGLLLLARRFDACAWQNAQHPKSCVPRPALAGASRSQRGFVDADCGDCSGCDAPDCGSCDMPSLDCGPSDCGVGDNFETGYLCGSCDSACSPWACGDVGACSSSKGNGVTRYETRQSKRDQRRKERDAVKSMLVPPRDYGGF